MLKLVFGFGFSVFAHNLFVLTLKLKFPPNTKTRKPKTVFSLQFFTLKVKKHSTKRLLCASNVVKSES